MGSETGGLARPQTVADDPIRVSVVVPHYEDLTSLELCLAALERQTFPRDAFEIIVADNGSPSGEAAIAAVVRGRARLVTVAERGAGPARNGGAAHARAEIVAFTDCDCQPEPTWLAEGVRALEGFDFVGGRMEVLVDETGKVTPAEAFELVFAFHNEAYVRDRGFTVTANLICHRAVFERVGGFLSSGVSEDYEWCHRARDMGFRIGYAPAAGVGHPARRTWPDLKKKWRRLNIEAFGLAAMKPGGRLKWALQTALMPASALAHTPRVLFSRNLRGAGQRWGALATLWRLRLWRTADYARLLLAGR